MQRHFVEPLLSIDECTIAHWHTSHCQAHSTLHTLVFLPRNNPAPTHGAHHTLQTKNINSIYFQSLFRYLILLRCFFPLLRIQTPNKLSLCEMTTPNNQNRTKNITAVVHTISQINRMKGVFCNIFETLNRYFDLDFESRKF